MSRKYLLVAGPVLSRRDGDVHWITAAMLAGLYGVPRRDCYATDVDTLSQFPYMTEGYIVLRPREDGNYRQPEFLKR